MSAEAFTTAEGPAAISWTAGGSPSSSRIIGKRTTTTATFSTMQPRTPLQVTSEESSSSTASSAVIEIPPLVDTKAAAATIEYTAKNNPWKQLTPSMWEDPGGIEVYVNWNAQQVSAGQVAGRWMDEIVAAIPSTRKSTVQKHAPRMRDQLAHSMERFVEFCRDHCSHTRPCHLFSARIITSRGSTGTRCPQWHVDNVPVRLLQSLEGPGCDYVQVVADGNHNGNRDDGVRWDLINRGGRIIGLANDGALKINEDEFSLLPVEERNDILVDPARADIGQGRPGQALMLIGKRWNEFVTGGRGSGGRSDNSDTGTTTTVADELLLQRRRPAVHKSPHNLQPRQGRVVLKIDVLLE